MEPIMTDLNSACDAFFDARPGWSRFNLEHCFRNGWNNRMGLNGRHLVYDEAGGYIAHTTERLVYTAGRLAAASTIVVD